MIKKHVIAAVMAAGAVFTMATQATAAKATDPESFKVGAILAMTGAAPNYGKIMSQAILLAVEEINAKGGIDGIPLEAVIEDHQSGKAKEGVAAMNRLLSLHGSQAVLTSFSAPTLAVAPIADREKVLLVNGGGVSPKLINASKYLVHNRQMASSLASGVVDLANSKKLKKMAIIHVKSDAGDSVRDLYKELWKGEGRETVAVESIVPGAANIDTQIAKIKVSRPDFVALGLFQPEIGLVLKRLRELGIKVPVMGIEWTSEDAKIAGAHAQGYEYVSEVFKASAENPWSKSFADAYKKKYGTEPGIYEANYYEGTYVIAELIRRAKAKGGDYWNGEALHKEIWDNPVMKSVYGPTMTFQKDTGTVEKPVAHFSVGADGKSAFIGYLGKAK